TLLPCASAASRQSLRTGRRTRVKLRRRWPSCGRQRMSEPGGGGWGAGVAGGGGGRAGGRRRGGGRGGGGGAGGGGGGGGGGAAAVLAVAVVGGLTAVVLVQQRANAELAAEQAKVQARFDMAAKAIATFHTGVSEDALLKNPQFKELRTKLLKQAAGFYADMEKLLEGQTDAKSRKTLAEGYFQLAELTDRIGDQKQALELHRKALAVRRELAAAAGADGVSRLEVARSLRGVGILLYYTGDRTGALRAWEEQRDIATALEAESATDPARAVLARSHNTFGVLLMETGKPAEALQSFQN